MKLRGYETLIGISIESNDRRLDILNGHNDAMAVVDDEGIVVAVDDGQGPEGYEFVRVEGGRIVATDPESPSSDGIWALRYI